MPQPVRVFISYAHEDDPYRIELEKALKLLEREGLIEPWSDRKILPGGSWAEAIDEEIERADLILLLVSHDFIASDYCWGVEVKRALERSAAGETIVVPIVVRATDWESAAFGQLQALPGEAHPVASWPDQDEAWRDVSKGLRRLIAEIQGRPAGAGGGDAPDPRRYLEALQAANSYVELRGMGAKVAERMPLDQVYTRLRVAPRHAEVNVADHLRKELDGRLMPEGAGAVELRDVLEVHSRAALIGDPGSGKTTFLRFVAQLLARASLKDESELALRELGLESAPFPIFERLSHFAEFLKEKAVDSLPRAAPEHFLDYLAFGQRGHLHGLPESYLGDRLRRGGCFLLLDGLDEVPEAQRDRVARIVEALVREVGGVNRVLLTCRTRAYQGMAQLAELESFELAPFENQQIEVFVRSWARALFRVDASNDAVAAEAEDYRESLSEAISSHPNVGPLTDSPLMLTMLAVVHWNKKRLPEQRAELYSEAVEYLLESRKAQSSYPTPLRREALQALALRMLEDPEGVQRSLGRLEAAEAVMPLLGLDRDAALDFLEDEALHSGLLVTRSQGELEFWHLTFQEYLGALELAMGGDYWKTLSRRLEDDRWSEVVLLFAGCLRSGSGLRAARGLVENILGSGRDKVSRARAVAIIGRILKDLRPYGGDAAAGTGYGEALSETLGIFEAGGETVDESVRVEVGEALGQAGDPRLANPDSLRVPLPGGSFWMGAQSTDRDAPGFDPAAHGDESPVHRIRVSAFDIGRYPVTVQEFRLFVEKDGYGNPRLWDSAGWAWRENEGILEPGAWERQERHPNRPVTEVSWYEADAYSRWVGGRLPTEAEWEYAARGPEGRRFPWSGDVEPNSAHANFEMRVRAPTPVGIYPLGTTPEGLHDLGGNVYEWCADWFGDYRERESEETAPCGPEQGSSRVLRGGAWYGPSIALRGAFRGYGPPDLRYGHFGFRVVWSSS